MVTMLQTTHDRQPNELRVDYKKKTKILDKNSHIALQIVVVLLKIVNVSNGTCLNKYLFKVVLFSKSTF